MLYNPIAVFDSGVGSLSIIRELRRQVPNENILYFADKAHFPYGNKSHYALLGIISETVKYLERYKPKVIIVASTTPSIQVLDKVKTTSGIPIVGVKPPLEEASRLTKKKHIGIMGTAGTIYSKELKEEIKRRVPQQILISKYDASPVVQLIEDGIHIRDERRTYDAIFRSLNEDLDLKLDVMLLASTHLPFIDRYLTALLPSVKLLEPSRNVVKVVRKILTSGRMLKKTGWGKFEILVSDKKPEFEKTIHNMGIYQPVREVFLTF